MAVQALHAAPEYQSVNPFSGKPFKSFELTTDAELEAKTAAAQACYETWRHKTYGQRAAIVAKGRTLVPNDFVVELAETLARGEQSMLLLNRRGFENFWMCRACGERMTAPDTDSWLVEHRYTGRLVCHLTGFSMPKPKACPHCGAVDSLVSIGPGVERVEEI